MKTALIIGGGFSGCAAAHKLAQLGGWDVTLVERTDNLGGGVLTMFYGGHPYTFGPRHFLTTWQYVFDYLNEIVPMRRCAEHEFVTYVEQDAAFYNFPIHEDDLPLMPEYEQIKKELANAKGADKAQNLEDYWLASIGQTLYRKFIESYSKKMWQIDDNTEIDDFGWSPKGATIKSGARSAWDQSISAYPIARNGYNDYFEIATSEAKVYLNTAIEAYDFQNKSVTIAGETKRYDIIVSSTAPDIPFNYCYGELPFVGRDFYKIVLPVEYALPENVYFAYYAGSEQFTRIVEYKKLTQHKSPHTIIGVEIPSFRNKLYPLPMEKCKAVAKRYHDECHEDVHHVGRAGPYLYNVDIDDCIKHAFDLAEKL